MLSYQTGEMLRLIYIVQDGEKGGRRQRKVFKPNFVTVEDLYVFDW